MMSARMGRHTAAVMLSRCRRMRLALHIHNGCGAGLHGGVTHTQQSKHTSSNRLLTAAGRPQPVVTWTVEGSTHNTACFHCLRDAHTHNVGPWAVAMLLTACTPSSVGRAAPTQGTARSALTLAADPRCVHRLHTQEEGTHASCTQDACKRDAPHTLTPHSSQLRACTPCAAWLFSHNLTVRQPDSPAFPHNAPTGGACNLPKLRTELGARPQLRSDRQASLPKSKPPCRTGSKQQDKHHLPPSYQLRAATETHQAARHSAEQILQACALAEGHQ